MRSCLDCGRPASASRCPAHQREHDRKRLATRTNREYRSSYAWRKLSEAKRQRDPWCEPCLARGIKTKARQVHHPDPRARGGALLVPMEELVSVCLACHGRLTRAEQQANPDRVDASPPPPPRDRGPLVA